VLVLERYDQLSSMARASTFHPPTLEMLETVGVTDELMRIGLRVDRYQFRDRRAGIIAEFDYSVLAGDTRYPFRIQCEQHLATPILLERLQKLDGRIRFGHRVRSVRQDDRGVDVEVETSDKSQTIRGQYVIGADGAHSAVRESVGVDFEGMTYPDLYLVTNTLYPLDQALPGLSLVNYLSDPDEWLAILHTSTNWRVLMPVPPAMAQTGKPDRAFVVQRLQGVVPDITLHDALDWSIYEVHQRVATTFRVGRVLLAGDAAHINSPLGGMGMNCGIHDAFFLAPRLWRAVVDNDAGGLDEYAARRRAVATEFVREDTHRNAQNLALKDPTARARRDAELRAASRDPERARQFLLRSSMLTSIDRADYAA
jgi:3-(3-hydroxy-phenyl)propionate hydroxylase